MYFKIFNIIYIIYFNFYFDFDYFINSYKSKFTLIFYLKAELEHL